MKHDVNKHDYLALDFDGVMCHSSPESSISAVIEFIALNEFSFLYSFSSTR